MYRYKKLDYIAADIEDVIQDPDEEVSAFILILLRISKFLVVFCSSYYFEKGY